MTQTLHTTAIDPAIAREFIELRDLIERASGISLDARSAAIVGERLAPRIKNLGLRGLAEYSELLRLSPKRNEELDHVLALISIHETSFFRDEAQLDALESVVLPSLIEHRRHVRRLRVWSAGCATGEEAFTLAIMLDRLLGAERREWTIDLLGTDLSPRCIEHAREGVYDGSSFRAINPIIQRRYFSSQDDRHHLEPEIREMARFERLNLRDHLAIRQLGVWDLILCRHVMVYMSEAMHAELSRTFDHQLADDGFILVGQHELACLDADRFAPDPSTSLLACRKRAVVPSLRAAA